MARQDEAAENQKKLIASSAASREATAKHQQEVQRNLAEVRASARRTRIFLWVVAVGLIVMVYGGEFLLAIIFRC
jgi:uncharacterized membrane protein